MRLLHGLKHAPSTSCFASISPSRGSPVKPVPDVAAGQVGIEKLRCQDSGLRSLVYAVPCGPQPPHSVPVECIRRCSFRFGSPVPVGRMNTPSAPN
ncbi:hypothetical protein CORC01_11459 [Colletotrichum orchidophilum]|uniref:Uncharacterized protein n=1 Tax=Colletotrichum orchidophilum TaxID=1209926 RepID=A0A1G4AVQ8_9PEZI|nr:uncharacterized protein CORC01_11459 [Colletotrichum orchidophilum]OHE93234.1 hypothetical protein CORC01_11459 [Colletotrichum orchidophilum]